MVLLMMMGVMVMINGIDDDNDENDDEKGPVGAGAGVITAAADLSALTTTLVQSWPSSTVMVVFVR